MTLVRQLILTLLGLVMILVAGIFTLNLKHVQSLLISQMELQTQKSADALAVALKPFFERDDMEGAATFVDGFFNRGYFQSLTISDPRHAQPVIERHSPKTINGVPEWFVNVVSLEGAVRRAEIQFYLSAHGQRRDVELETATAHAYEQLWIEVKEWLLFSALLLVAGVAILILLVRWQLAPLKVIEQQADAISRRDFSFTAVVPETRELGSVVRAMNSMAEKLKRYIHELTQQAEALLRETRIDDVTGLMTRQAFMDNLDTVMEENGVIVLVQLANLKHINDMFGYPTGNHVLSSIAEQLHREQELYGEAFAGRISGSEFALAVPGLNIEEFHDVYGQLESHLNIISDSESVDYSGLKIVIGVAGYESEHAKSSILSRANHALALALHQNKGLVYLGLDDQPPLSFTSTDWGKTIDQVIENADITLTAQEVVVKEGDQLFQMVLSKPNLEDKQKLHSASFIAMVERLGRGNEFDRLIVNKVAEHLAAAQTACTLSIKLLSSSWYSQAFQAWLLDQLHANPQLARYLYISCSESYLIRDVAVSSRHISALRKLGVKIIMDHFGVDLASFSSLRKLSPDYIKLDGSYIRDIVDNDDHRMFLKTVVDISHGLDIKVIAEHVETEQASAVLHSMGVDAFQGYGISGVELL